MPAEGRAQSEPPGQNASACELLMKTNPYEDDDPVLATFKRSPVKKRNPNAKWDGRVSGMSLQEYRERKWSVDACYAKVERRGPAYSIRRPLPTFLDLQKKGTNFAVGDPVEAHRRTLKSSASYTMGYQMFQPAPEKSCGPAEYMVKSTMDPSSHPTISKNCGARFGSEVLQPRDPTGPAPGDYDANAAMVYSSGHGNTQQPRSIQGREAWRAPTAAPGPGVGEFKYEDTLRTGKMTPLRFTMQGKTEPLKMSLGQRQFVSPGPDHYKLPSAVSEHHPTKSQSALWKFGTEPRGLRT